MSDHRTGFLTDPLFLDDYRRLCNWLARFYQQDVDADWIIADETDVDAIEDKALSRCVDLGNAIGMGVFADYRENQPHITYDTVLPLVICLDLNKQLDATCQIAGVRERTKFYFANRIYYAHGIKACLRLMVPDELINNGLKVDLGKIVYWAGMYGDEFLVQPEDND